MINAIKEGKAVLCDHEHSAEMIRSVYPIKFRLSRDLAESWALGGAFPMNRQFAATEAGAKLRLASTIFAQSGMNHILPLMHGLSSRNLHGLASQPSQIENHVAPIGLVGFYRTLEPAIIALLVVPLIAYLAEKIKKFRSMRNDKSRAFSRSDLGRNIVKFRKRFGKN